MTNIRRAVGMIYFLFVVAISLYGQGWERAYEFEEIPIPWISYMFNEDNGEHVCFGYEYSYGGVDNISGRIFWMKINALGDTISLKEHEIIGMSRGAAKTDNGIIHSSVTYLDHLHDSIVQTNLTKLDVNGNLEWNHVFDGHLGGDIVVSSQGGFLMLERPSFASSLYPDTLQLIKFDELGNLIWRQIYPDVNHVERGERVVELPDSNIIVMGTSRHPDENLVLLKTDANGDAIWRKLYPEWFARKGLNLKISISNDLLVTGDSSILKFDLDGNLLWSKTFEGQFIHDFEELPNGDLLFTAREEPSQTNLFRLFKTDTEGEIIWVKTFIRPFDNLGAPLINLTSDDGILLGAYAQNFLQNQDFAYIFKLDSNGNIYSGFINGQVKNDENNNCLTDQEEFLMENWMVSAANAETTLYGLVDADGNYEINLDTGNYLVNVLEPFNYWEPCMDSVWQEINPFDTVEIDFAMQGIVDCPLLTVDIAVNQLRRCTSNFYQVHYCNDGTITGEDAFIEIEFDEEIIVDSAEVMWTAVSGNVYTFVIGDIAINECGDFWVATTLDPNCDAIGLGETYCAEAHIFPDSFCLFDPTWDLSSIEVNGECEGDSIHFYIENIGEAPMSEFLQYIVTEDNIMRANNPFLLNPQEILKVSFEATGTTMRMDAGQAFGHPGFRMPNTTIEGCDPDGDGNFSIGFFTQWPNDDADPFVSIECREVVGSFDPNDKQASPRGVDEQHYIRENMDIEYYLRFQNIGNAEAFKVRITDTLSPFLDISTIQLGASSFPYRFEILPNNVLQFTFEDINLPPEALDEPGSHGFVKYRVSQYPNNPIGTIIYNTAQIFFDNNAPIVTNTTYHEIGEDFIEILLSNNENIKDERVKVIPNPFNETTQFSIISEKNEKAVYTLKVLNTIGQIIRLEEFQEASYDFHRKNLSDGLYLFTIENKGELITTGKMMIQ